MPKRILDLMNVDGLTRENVASHLQVCIYFVDIMYLFGDSLEKKHVFLLVSGENNVFDC